MKILTSRKKSQDFAIYFLLSGLSLLVTSFIYFKRLESAWKYEQCDYIFEDENDLCADLCIWTICAGTGIGIGFLNILLFLFLVCWVRSFCWCWNWNSKMNGSDFGYKLSFLDENDKTENSASVKPLDQRYFDTSRNKTTRHKVKTSHVNNDCSGENIISLDLQNKTVRESKLLSPPFNWCLELISWTFFIVTPLTGTVFVAVALYKSDAYRTEDENLYHPGLSLFLSSILNLVIFCQQFMWSLCRKLCRKLNKSLYEKYEYNKWYKSSKNGHVTSHSQIQSV